ncbi:MAG: DNA repair protein RecO [Kiritimatiellia bacterium]
MAGEIIKTTGIVLAIHPWSRTSHVVAWLTPDHGCVTTLVKGAVRPKSAFLGQYDFFYTCDLLYYARASNDLHALRETVPTALREGLRGRWRETALAGYAATLIRELVPAGSESAGWYAFFEHFLDHLAMREPPACPPETFLADLIQLEMSLLGLSGQAPDFSGMPREGSWAPFSIDRGRFGEGSRTIRLSRSTVAALQRPDAAALSLDAKEDAARFLGIFLAYHFEAPPDIRRSLVHLLTA